MARPTVHGFPVDDDTRCVHYATALDIVALKFGCCERYYPCFQCHDESTDHPRQPWPAQRANEPSVLCGVCSTELLAAQYMHATQCPVCSAVFNPNCAAHYPLYFEVDDGS